MLPISKRGIDPCVDAYIESQSSLEGKVALDIPAGNGRFSQRLAAKGATVISMDLFPQFFEAEELECKYADMTKRLPLEDESVDLILCQEGIEHVSDQFGLLKEFNRILRKGGQLLLTTPSYSHLRARISNLLVESEYWKRMPPSEIDSVWFSDENASELYFGHLFLISAQKLRSLAAISGFEIAERRFTDVSYSSLLLAIVMYPAIFCINHIASYLSARRLRHLDSKVKQDVLNEQREISCSLTTLICKHHFWIMTKYKSEEEMLEHLKTISKN